MGKQICEVSATSQPWEKNIRKRLATLMYVTSHGFKAHLMNIDRAKMKTCAVVCPVLIKIRRIIALQLCYSSWLPAISQKI